MTEGHWLSSVSATVTGLVMVASCAGWGRLLARWSRVPADPGLSLGWGLAVLLFLGGCATALGVARASVLIGLVGVGVVAAWATMHWRPPVEISRRTAALAGGVALVLLVKLVMAAHTVVLQPADDFLGYQPLITQLLQTGNMEAPFSLRRLAAYGGQILLQAMAVPSGDFNGMVATDAGLGPIFVFALGYSFLARTGQVRPLCVLVAVALALGTLTRLNTASQATSLACFLTLVRTLQMVAESDHRLRLYVIYGLVAAGAGSLRHLNLPFPALLLLAFLTGQAARLGWRTALGENVVAGLAWTLFLTPWMVALYASSATPLYPLIKGYHRPDFDFSSAPGGWKQVVWMVLGVFANVHIYKLLIFVPLAYMFRHDRSLRAVQTAALVGAVVVMAAFPGAEAFHIARYIQPTLATAFVPTVLAVLSSDMIRTPLVRRGVVVVLAIMVGQSLRVDIERLGGWMEPVYHRGMTLRRMAVYAEAQKLVPPGQGIFVYVSTPFAFDFSRNRVINADEPGPVSPPPGLPFFQGADSLAEYLRGQGLRYVVYEDSRTALVECLRLSGIELNDEQLWQPWKPYLYDFMANLDRLRHSRPVLLDKDGVFLIDLEEIAAPLRVGSDRHSP